MAGRARRARCTGQRPATSWRRCELLGREVAFDGDAGVDKGQLRAGFGGGNLCGGELGLRGLDVFDGEVDGDVVEGPLLVGGVHAHGDGDAGAERGEQELVGGGTEIVATVGELLVGGDDVAAVARPRRRRCGLRGSGR